MEQSISSSVLEKLIPFETNLYICWRGYTTYTYSELYTKTNIYKKNLVTGVLLTKLNPFSYDTKTFVEAITICYFHKFKRIFNEKKNYIQQR